MSDKVETEKAETAGTESVPMPGIVDKQFSLLPNGALAFQSDATNPLPGAPVAVLRKGAAALAPAFEITESGAGALASAGVGDLPAFSARLALWLDGHVRKVLEPLFALENLVAAGGPVGAVAQGVLDGIGIARRADLGAAISGLEADGRTALRQKKLRLGPVFLYLLEGNKPAAVRLRGILWALWNDVSLPPPLPHDGAVSALCPNSEIDPAFWTAIGYPLCGPRVIRVDMHDRLVQSIYDAAEKGIFRARHEMAEWLGCPISDLYAVLESLGHRRIEDAPVAPMPAAIVVSEASEGSGSSEGSEISNASETSAESVGGAVAENSSETAPGPSPEPSNERTASDEGKVSDESTALDAPSALAPASDSLQKEETKDSSKKPEKPELARFRLGHAPGSSPQDRRGSRPPRDRDRKPFHNSQSPETQDSSPDNRDTDRHGKSRDRDRGRARNEHPSDRQNTRPGRDEGKNPGFGRDKGPRRDGSSFREDRKNRPGKHPGKEDRADRPERILRAEAKVDPEDSPFAILRNFKLPGS